MAGQRGQVTCFFQTVRSDTRAVQRFPVILQKSPRSLPKSSRRPLFLLFPFVLIITAVAGVAASPRAVADGAAPARAVGSTSTTCTLASTPTTFATAGRCLPNPRRTPWPRSASRSPTTHYTPPGTILPPPHPRVGLPRQRPCPRRRGLPPLLRGTRYASLRPRPGDALRGTTRRSPLSSRVTRPRSCRSAADHRADVVGHDVATPATGPSLTVKSRRGEVSARRESEESI